MIPKPFSNDTFRPIAWLAIVSLVFFLLVAIAQSFYIENQAREEALAQLSIWAKDINKSIYLNNEWDFEGYQQDQAITANYEIISADGLVIDIEGFIPHLIPTPKFSLKLKPDKIQTFTTNIGQHWRLLLKPVKHGAVILGVQNPRDSIAADKELDNNAKIFIGLTVDESEKIQPREIGVLVEYAVIDSLSFLRIQWGGIPTEMNKDIFNKLLKDSVIHEKIGDKEFLALANPIVNTQYGKTVGLVFVTMDITLQQQALHVQKVFNYTVAGLSFIVIILIFGGFWVAEERRKRRQRIPIEKALNALEDVTLEFKETLEYVDKDSLRASGVPVDKLPEDKLNEKVNQLQKDVLHSSLKTICAFLNTNGGTLFIGVTDKKPRVVKGIERDLKLCGKQNEDGLELKLRDYLKDRFRSSPLGKTDIRFESFEGKEVCVIDVQPTSKKEPVTLDEKFYVRDGGRTIELNGQRLADWLRDRLRG